MELAAEVVERVPGAEMVRLVSSGTEAAMTAVRLARAGDGPRQGDQVRRRLPRARRRPARRGRARGSRRREFPPPRASPRRRRPTRSSSRGTTPTALEAAVERAGDELAAVLAEPLPANMGLVPPREGFLRAARARRATATGALLVLDEVISGFRVAPRRRAGAARRDAGPDDARQGAGRRPAAGRGRRARAALMERLAPAGETYQAGTLSGQPARDGGRPRDARPARRRRLRAARATTARLAAGLAERPRGAGVHGAGRDDAAS